MPSNLKKCKLSGLSGEEFQQAHDCLVRLKDIVAREEFEEGEDREGRREAAHETAELQVDIILSLFKSKLDGTQVRHDSSSEIGFY
jgi:hypothetical protein